MLWRNPPPPSALVPNGGEGLHYDPWPELRTLVSNDGWKLQHDVGEGHLELDHLAEDPSELDPAAHPAVTQCLLGLLVDAGSQASVTGRQTGRW